MNLLIKIFFSSNRSTSSDKTAVILLFHYLNSYSIHSLLLPLTAKLEQYSILFLFCEANESHFITCLKKSIIDRGLWHDLLSLEYY